MASTPRIDRLENNTIINGNFDFWQRGTFFNSNVYTTDRWLRAKTAPPAWEWTQSTDVPTLAQSGFQSTYSLLMDTTASPGAVAAGQTVGAVYRVEGYDFAKHLGNTFTVCFWVKSAQARTFALSLRNGAFDRSYVSEVTINASNTWEFKSVAVTHDGIGTWGVTNGIGANITLDFGSGTDAQTSSTDQWVAGNKTSTPNVDNILDSIANDVKISQFQILQGDLTGIGVIPFRRAGRNISDEFQMCERYYEVCEMRFRATLASGSIEANYAFHTMKRASPTIVVLAGTMTSVRSQAPAVTMASTSSASGNGTFTADAELL